MERTHQDVFPLTRPGMRVALAYGSGSDSIFGGTKLIGAYWTVDCPGPPSSYAEAFLGIDGTAKIYAFFQPEKRNGTWCRGNIIFDPKGDIERGKDMPPEVREALEEAILKKLMADQAASLRPNSEDDGLRDQWGNLVE